MIYGCEIAGIGAAIELINGWAIDEIGAAIEASIGLAKVLMNGVAIEAAAIGAAIGAAKLNEAEAHGEHIFNIFNLEN